MNGEAVDLERLKDGEIEKWNSNGVRSNLQTRQRNALANSAADAEAS